MPDGINKVLALSGELRFSVAGDDHAVGEVMGVPTGLTLLSADPPGVMFAFRVRPDSEETDRLASLVRGSLPARSELSVEDGCAWLTLYDLDLLPHGAAKPFAERVADALIAVGMAIGPGCLRCGAAEGAAPMLVDLRPTRLCASCLNEAVREKIDRESELNRPTLSTTLSLPGAVTYVVLGWIVLWTVIDVLLRHWPVRVVEINQFTTLVGLVLLGGIGCVLGWPLGATLRRSFGLGLSPWMASLGLALAAGVLGEVGYVALRIFLLAGVLDFAAAARMLGPVIGMYTGFWIFCKLATIGAIAGWAAASASRRAVVPMDV